MPFRSNGVRIGSDMTEDYTATSALMAPAGA